MLHKILLIYRKSPNSLKKFVRLITGITIYFKSITAFKMLLRKSWALASKSFRKIQQADLDRSYLIRIKYKFLKKLLSIPNRYYIYNFRKLSHNLSTMIVPNYTPEKDSIQFIIGTLGPGGAERQAVATIIGLKKKGIKKLCISCVFLQHSWQKFFLDDITNEQIPVYELTKTLTVKAADISKIISQLPDTLHSVADYCQSILDNRPQVLHLWMDECNIRGGIAGVILQVPKIILGLRSLPPTNFSMHLPYMLESYRWLAKQSNIVFVANSIAGARAYEEWIGLPLDSIQVIHNGFELEPNKKLSFLAGREAYRTRFGIPHQTVVVGSIMRLGEEKQPLLWLKIASLLHQQLPNLHFLLVGDGNLRKKVEKHITSLNLTNFVHLVGYEKEALAALAAIDLFLLTSRIEGLPNVLIEAQAMGVPVITTNAGGAAETIENQITGLVLKTNNPIIMAKQIEELIKNQKWLTQARLRAPQYISQQFSTQQMIDKTLKLYNIKI